MTSQDSIEARNKEAALSDEGQERINEIERIRSMSFEEKFQELARLFVEGQKIRLVDLNRIVNPKCQAVGSKKGQSGFGIFYSNNVTMRAIATNIVWGMRNRLSGNGASAAHLQSHDGIILRCLLAASAR